jgi:type I restriction enzyme S subunit
VQGRWVSLEAAKRTTVDFYQLLTEGNRSPEPGDLVFSCNATVGEVAEVPEKAEPFALGQDVVLLKRQKKSNSSSYAWHLLRSTAVVN